MDKLWIKENNFYFCCFEKGRFSNQPRRPLNPVTDGAEPSKEDPF